MDAWLLEHLVCPRDGKSLTYSDGVLTCPDGHRYPVIDGVPVMLVDDVDQTFWVAAASMQGAASAGAGTPDFDPYFVDTIGVWAHEKPALQAECRNPGPIDPVVRYLVAQTNGILYKSLVGQLGTYPIPEIRLPQSQGERMLDIGCSWGRWCNAAAAKGYKPVGIDPSLGAVMAAKRVARQRGVDALFVVGDGRFPPFKDGSFDVVFSYSVLQHFSKDNVRTAISAVKRVLKPGGYSFIQMPNALGIRSFYHLARRKFREPKNFEVRYWLPGELKRAFDERIGPSKLSVDGYFGLGIQKSDLHLMPPFNRLVIRTSEVLRKISQYFTPIIALADSLYVRSERKA